MIASIKLITIIFALCTVLINASRVDDMDDDNAIDSTDYSLLNLMMSRETASDFNDNTDESNDNYQQGNMIKSLAKRKHDAEEIKEIQTKAESRRRKAFKNYEESCKIRGKFIERSCPKLSECYAKNKLPFVPIVETKPTTALAVTSTALVVKPSIKPKVNREFILRELANQFLQEDDDDEDNDEETETDEFEPVKRLFKSKTSELQEESNERRNKAFKKYEEYCEKRVFRIGSERNCPALNKKLC